MQGLAAGLMLSISFFDLMPESVEAVGKRTASLCFFLGESFVLRTSTWLTVCGVCQDHH